jgi:hypothetical protein
MSTISEKTNELFMASSLSDDDLGYPNEVSFVPSVVGCSHEPPPT